MPEIPGLFWSLCLSASAHNTVLPAFRQKLSRVYRQTQDKPFDFAQDKRITRLFQAMAAVHRRSGFRIAFQHDVAVLGCCVFPVRN